MARALCGNNAAALSAALSDGVSLLISRRGYAAATAAAERRGIRAAEEKFVGMRRDVVAGEASSSSSWVPDPVTGYYRPGNRAGELDAAELREMLLSRAGRD